MEQENVKELKTRGKSRNRESTLQIIAKIKSDNLAEIQEGFQELYHEIKEYYFPRALNIVSLHAPTKESEEDAMMWTQEYMIVNRLKDYPDGSSFMAYYTNLLKRAIYIEVAHTFGFADPNQLYLCLRMDNVSRMYHIPLCVQNMYKIAPLVNQNITQCIGALKCMHRIDSYEQIVKK